MTNFLLIDTCVLKQLVNKIEFSTDLKWIDRLIKEKDFKLLVPEDLWGEWFNKHREEELARISKAMAEHRKNEKFKKTFQLEDAVLEEKSDFAKRLLESQVELIDDLLKEGIQIKTSDKVSKIVLDHRRKKFAPFKVKEDSIEDASIIFSSLSFMNDLPGQNKIYFISGNHADFGFPNGDRFILHPEITGVYPTVPIEYFTQISEFKKRVDPTDPKSKRSGSKLNPVIEVDKSQPLLDQLLEYLEKRFKELKFLPIQLFAYHYPFLKADHKPYNNRPFTIYTDNEELFRLFKGFIEGHGKDAKWIKVTRILYNNNVRFLSDVRENRIEIPVIPDQSTQLRKAYENLDLNQLILHLNGQNLDLSERAYYSYKIGLFKESSILQQKAIDSVNDRSPLRAFIGWFNQKRLIKFIEFGIDSSPELELLDELKAIDIGEKFAVNKQLETKEIISWIHENRFLTDTSDIVIDHLNEIRDAFHTKVVGFHDHTGHLLDQFSRFESFLTVNFIVFDSYNEFLQIAESFIEGLFASHASNENLSGRLLHFDDYTLNKIMLHGKPEFIKKCAARYSFESLKYEINGDDGEQFMDWARNILTGYKESYKNYLMLPGAAPWYMTQTLQRHTQNIVILGSLITLDAELLDKLALLILEFGEDQDLFPKQKMPEIIEYFLQKRHSRLSNKTLIRFFKLGVLNQSFHDSNFLHTTGFYLERRKLSVAFKEKEMDAILLHFTGECSGCKVKHPLDMLGAIFLATKTKKFKTRISEKAGSFLSSSFDPLEYAHATFYDMIPQTTEGNEAYLNYIEAILDKGRINKFFSIDFYYFDTRIDFFLNCWFKLGFNISIHILEKIRSLDPYYQWLTNLDGFDYSSFNAKWLNHYFTKFYKWHFRKSKVLKKFLVKSLTKEFDEQVSRFYIATYFRKD